MAVSPHHRHQSSLEGVISFSSQPPLGAERARANAKFHRIVDHFKEAADGQKKGPYNRPLLVRLTYEYARSQESKDIFLRAFFQAMDVQIDGKNDIDFDTDERLGSALTQFANHLVDHFFLPLLASSNKTPQLSPAPNSAFMQVQGGGVPDFVGTPEQVTALRQDCLIRDRHRCVISRRFDVKELEDREKISGDQVTDDDGKPFEASHIFSRLEVAHILPHALTSTEKGSELSASKKAALDILNMFDSGVIHLIEGSDIDRPRNAITLDHTLHYQFGRFKIFFEPVAGQQHTYQIRSFLSARVTPGLPVQRTLFLTENRNIDPPSPRFLAIHCAIAHILHLSAAGDYIEKILEDMEWKDTRADGGTELGRLVGLRLSGWLDRAVAI
ncbi:hypothetical protein B0T21DRAFT_295268 [Apiosordaria backusii]|uniref:HNH nuclease domain-containing protein n=1 Tax=Apiosordaria backusii TaxID=314023 RepID=A0AA40AN32_9PEZI|nr:hypothetical protein B0T21DRAFT_295268 [Apiosordaria backusii]